MVRAGSPRHHAMARSGSGSPLVHLRCASPMVLPAKPGGMVALLPSSNHQQQTWAPLLARLQPLMFAMYVRAGGKTCALKQYHMRTPDWRLVRAPHSGPPDVIWHSSEHVLTFNLAGTFRLRHRRAVLIKRRRSSLRGRHIFGGVRRGRRRHRARGTRLVRCATDVIMLHRISSSSRQQASGRRRRRWRTADGAPACRAACAGWTRNALARRKQGGWAACAFAASCGRIAQA